MTTDRPLFEAHDIHKCYDVPVLFGVNLDIHGGECHALIGENGAGKTTLVKIISGLTPATRGDMRLSGEPFRPKTRRQASASGVRTVLQELTAIDTLTVAESIFIGTLPHRWGWLERDTLNRQARRLLDSLGLSGLDPQQPISDLGIGQRQMVEVAGALSQPCRLLVLDEPTAALTATDVDRLFGVLAKLQAAGTAILYISHRLEEIRQLANRVTVLRDGADVTTQSTSLLSTEEMIRLMVGRRVCVAVTRTKPPTGRPALRVQHLRSAPAVRDVSFAVHWGEILGFAGLVGSGRTETMRAIYGADLSQAGELFLEDSDTPTAFHSPRQAAEHGLAFLGEDRRRQGILDRLSVRANLSLVALRNLANRIGWLNQPAEQEATGEFIRRLDVKCTSPDQPIERLSGGNQQKALLARWLMQDPRILIVDEPTRGIDPGARAEVHRLLTQLADQGCAILMVSSDLHELTTVADRIAVLSRGRLVDIFERHAFGRERIMAAAFSEYGHPPRRADDISH